MIAITRVAETILKTNMTPDRWQRVKDIFSQASALAECDRSAFLDKTCEDAELRAEVDSLLQAHQASRVVIDRSAVDYLTQASVVAEERRIGERIGNYEIIGLIGRGGMGAVYRARRADAQYEKEVAIKLVRSGYDVGYVLERFRAERQILAHLDHPNIARLLDGGATKDGMPYLAMELVAGMPIDRYCDEHALSIGERLKLFRDVCSAVSYAHQRLIVHRDLKPSNILVTADGTVKLLDFGIAKLLQDGPNAASATVTFMQALTPAFSSPEQILGAPVTTASDIYSLGVVLYHLLAGLSPYQTTLTTTQDALREVCEKEPCKPSEARQRSTATTAVRIDRDLDDITLKALRKEPASRYSSVEQFADDIGRYLDGLPVLARGDQFSYRARKFMRRHRIGVSAAALVMIAIGVGVTATLREANIAREQAQLAQTERARAEKRFNDVRQLSDSLIFDIHDAIQNLPGATPARKLLLDRAVDYLDSVAKDAAGEPDLQRELAWGYQRLAVVQGSPTESNLGDLTAAIASDRKALANFEAVAQANPRGTIDQLNVAMMHRILAYSSLTSPNGRRDLEQAMAISGELIKRDPTNSKVKSERSIEYQNLALMEDAAGNRAHAVEAFQENQRLKLEILNADPNYRMIRRGVGNAAIQLGVAQARIGERAEALKTISQGVDIYAAEAKRADDVHISREFAIARQRRAEVLLMDGDARTAQAIYRETRADLEALASKDPEDTLLQADLAWNDCHDGQVLATLGRHDEARTYFEHALTRFTALHRKSPAADDAPNEEGIVHLWLGDTYDARGNVKIALTHYQAAAQVFGIEPKPEMSDDARLDLALAYARMANAHAKLRQMTDAITAVDKAIQIVPSLPESYNNVPALYTLAQAHAYRAAILVEQARTEHDKIRGPLLLQQARESYDQSLAFWKRIPNPAPIAPNGFLARDPTSIAQAKIQRFIGTQRI